MKKFSAIFAILLTGCAVGPLKLYEGPERSPSNVSVVRAWSPSSGNVAVQKIDGNEFQNGRISHLYVLPGEHVLTVRYLSRSGTHFSFSRDLKMVAKEGHFYVVSATPDFEKMTVQFDIEDKGKLYDLNCLIPKPFEKNGLQGINC